MLALQEEPLHTYYRQDGCSVRPIFGFLATLGLVSEGDERASSIADGRKYL